MHSTKLHYRIIQMCIFLITCECCTKRLAKNVQRLSLEHEIVKLGFIPGRVVGVGVEGVDI